MNDIPLNEDIEVKCDSQVLISTNEEIEQLASELADSYIDYFIINTSEQKQKNEDSIEECLTHLEEVCSVLDSYRTNENGELAKVIEKLSGKNESLNKLFDQVDAIEQYILETNRLLDQLNVAMKELSSHKRISSNRIWSILDKLPKLSLAHIPRLNLLNSMNTEEFSANLDERIVNDDTTVASLDEILTRVLNIQQLQSKETSELYSKLYSKSVEEVGIPHSSVSLLDCNLPEQIDDSWQELL